MAEATEDDPRRPLHQIILDQQAEKDSELELTALDVMSLLSFAWAPPPWSPKRLQYTQINDHS